MIGLRRGTVSLAEYDPDWVNEFENEKKLLGQVFRGTPIEHIGSTAVPGLVAKPIIDIAVGLTDFETWRNYVPELEALGYHYMPERVSADEVFMPKGTDELRTHYLHIVPMRGTEWNNTLRFRDALRADQELAGEYRAIKTSLAEANAKDRYSYTAAKSGFIDRVLSHSI